eukprot:TRINITY_DN5186_c0_g1_i1.p1 TRINITY_DN5186_c0_g1~~TRINITY_DN5186_c0_g1_i1.p1  ORF type:complete len:179 (-),score=53.63 TRINITY_DN5186_c0_g1_i1:36-572(-)
MEDAETYVRLERGSARSRVNRADIMGDMGMPDVAEEDFMTALAMDEQEVLRSEPNVYFLLATYKKDKNLNDEAMEFLKKHEERHKNEILSPHFHAFRSRLYLLKGMTKEAVADCKKALLQEVNPDFLSQMAKALGEDGQFEESLVYFDKAMKLDKQGKMRKFVMEERQKVIEKYAASE